MTRDQKIKAKASWIKINESIDKGDIRSADLALAFWASLWVNPLFAEIEQLEKEITGCAP